VLLSCTLKKSRNQQTCLAALDAVPHAEIRLRGRHGGNAEAARGAGESALACALRRQNKEILLRVRNTRSKAKKLGSSMQERTRA
jgi:hypothetical protein